MPQAIIQFDLYLKMEFLALLRCKCPTVPDIVAKWIFNENVTFSVEHDLEKTKIKIVQSYSALMVYP